MFLMRYFPVRVKRPVSSIPGIPVRKEILPFLEAFNLHLVHFFLKTTLDDFHGMDRLEPSLNVCECSRVADRINLHLHCVLAEVMMYVCMLFPGFCELIFPRLIKTG